MHKMEGHFVRRERGEKPSLQPISLSKLSTIKEANFSEYITKDAATNLHGVPIVRS